MGFAAYGVVTRLRTPRVAAPAPSLPSSDTDENPRTAEFGTADDYIGLVRFAAEQEARSPYTDGFPLSTALNGSRVRHRWSDGTYEVFVLVATDPGCVGNAYERAQCWSRHERGGEPHELLTNEGLGDRAITGHYVRRHASPIFEYEFDEALDGVTVVYFKTRPGKIEHDDLGNVVRRVPAAIAPRVGFRIPATMARRANWSASYAITDEGVGSLIWEVNVIVGEYWYDEDELYPAPE